MYGELIPIGAGDPFQLFKTEMTVGRHKDCDIVLNYPNVSGKHCKLFISEGYWYIIDLQSTNGVKVNGKKTENSRVDPRVPLTISTHAFKIEYNPMQNGADGLVPPSIFREDEILSQSLMQRAGLERKKAATDESGEETAPQSVSTVTTAGQPKSTKDFFAELVFD